MIQKALISFAGFVVLALAGCGKKEAAEPVAESQETEAVEENAAVENLVSAPSTEAASRGAEITKASSQGAAAELQAGVFGRAAEGEPEAVYLARCQYCHIQLGPGTITLAKRLGPEEALLANRTDLSEGYVKAVVRNGLNTMPAITRVEVNDAELELIAEYLTRNSNLPQE